MYAIVNIAGQQLKVEKDQELFVNRVAGKEGDSIAFDEVLLVENDGSTEVGAPLVAGASVSAKVVEHLKGDKVIVFKKKRRKGYQKRNGHRQLLTKIAIEGIALNGKKKSAPAKKSASADDGEAKAKAELKAKEEAAKAEAAKKAAAANKAEETKKAAAAEKAAEKPAPKAKGDDLTKVDGIGPKTKEVLHGKGITTFAKLADTPHDKLIEILEEAGPAYAAHAPDTWPEQAKFAAEGKFDELEAYVNKLKEDSDKA